MKSETSATSDISINLNESKPILKWAGGKTQLLNDIDQRLPSKYTRYIEPFFGGGALFFHLKPKNSIIADSNPELINLYNAIANDVDKVIDFLKEYKNDEKMFYEVRALDWLLLDSYNAAARTIYLNHTCYNGLYRVNKSGGFNVPFGHYKNPRIIDEKALRVASLILKETTIICADYKDVLRKYVRRGDLVFLDPPYLPISEYSDFKRYTKDQFHEKDHRELASEVQRLHEMGCNVILTNSNHPLVHSLYSEYTIDIIQTKRHISSVGKKRVGEDVIVTALCENASNGKVDHLKQLDLYPTTRYMGSKSKLLDAIWLSVSKLQFESVLDLFSGSGIVGYMFKSHGKKVYSNDYMFMPTIFAKALIENNNTYLSTEEIFKLLETNNNSDHFVQNTFRDLYFTEEENILIDNIRANIKLLDDNYKRCIALASLIRACLKKRPRGIFTYIGFKYNDGRKDLTKSFGEQFIDAAKAINGAIFDNGKVNEAFNFDAMKLDNVSADLVYIDPPYFSPLSDNEYVRRYHFVEGIARDWQGVEIQEHTKTKKFKSYPTPFSTRQGTIDAFDRIFSRYSDSILLVSYSSNSEPNKDEMLELLSRYKEHIKVIPINYKYSFGNHGDKVGNNRNDVQEYIFIAY